jgi:DNA (cytosine-5)-methyltransferase 1
MSGGIPYANKNAPSRLRRLTVDEAHLLQTFPEDFHFIGKQSSVFRQIGNAVPCNLAEAVAKLALSILDTSIENSILSQEVNYELGF